MLFGLGLLTLAMFGQSLVIIFLVHNVVHLNKDLTTVESWTMKKKSLFFAIYPSSLVAVMFTIVPFAYESQETSRKWDQEFHSTDIKHSDERIAALEKQVEQLTAKN